MARAARFAGPPRGLIAAGQFRSAQGVLTPIGTITVFGTPADITLSGLALEAFVPADDATAAAVRRLAARLGPREPQPQDERPTTA